MPRRVRAAATPVLAALLATLLNQAAMAQPLPCNAAGSDSALCSCDVTTLRPLQGALGYGEAQDKERKIRDKPDKERRELGNDPIKVIRGPGGELFITDHHHGADAWLRAGRPMAVCRIDKGPAFGTEAEFWAGLEAVRLVRLRDEHGRPITPAQLPKSLDQMPDDPFRTLAWRVRKAGGFCRHEMEQTEFAEFTWADWLRTRPELQAEVAGDGGVTTAVALARSQAAQAVPGWVGGKPAGFVCPKED